MTTKVETAIDELFKTPLADGRTPTDAQRADAVIVLARDCRMDGDKVVLVTTGEALNSDASKEWIKTNKPHLLPTKYETPLADRAFAENNLTARGQLVKEVGKDEADKIAQSYGLKSSTDARRGTAPARADDGKNKTDNATKHKSNPFWRGNWNISTQGKLLRAVGPEKCAAIAKAVGSRIGATKPNLDY